MTYEVSYSIVLYANYYIDADSKEDALVKGVDLLNNDDFRENELVPTFDEPLQWADALSECRVKVFDDDVSGYEPTFPDDQMEKWLG